MLDFLNSEDLEKLSRAIDARCRMLSIRPDSADGQMVASQLFALFRSGITDETELANRPLPLSGAPSSS